MTDTNNSIHCEFCNRSNNETRIIKSEKFSMTLCNRHYMQMQTHGKILDKTNRDLNTIIVCDDYAKVLIENNDEIIEILIDIEDIDKIKNYKWYLNDSGYAISHLNNKRIRMHKLIYNSRDIEVDHKSRNKKDNRKQNLRQAYHIDNSANCPIRTNNQSGVIGVSFDNKNKKWRVSITRNYKAINLGRYLNMVDAIVARLNAELKYFGADFAPQRHLFEKYNILGGYSDR